MLNLNDFSFLSEILNVESVLSVPSFEFAGFFIIILWKQEEFIVKQIFSCGWN